MTNNNRKSAKFASVVLTCGLPGSGKSSLARAMAAHFSRPITTITCGGGGDGGGSSNGGANSDHDAEGHELSQLRYGRVVVIDYDELARELAGECAAEGGHDDGATALDTAPTEIMSPRQCTRTEAEYGADASSSNNKEGGSFEESDLRAWREARKAALQTLRTELISHFNIASVDDSNCQNDENGHNAAADCKGGGDEEQVPKQEKERYEEGEGGLLVIMDDNFHLRSMRRDVHKVCQEMTISSMSTSSSSAIRSQAGECEDDDEARGECYNKDDGDDRPSSPLIGLSVIYVNCPLEICLERNAARSGKDRVPDDVIRNMAQTMERPDPENSALDYSRRFESCAISVEGGSIPSPPSSSSSTSPSESAVNHSADELYRLNSQRIEECLLQALHHHPVVPSQRQEEQEVDPQVLRAERERTHKSLVHRADRLLRALVGAVGRADKSMGRKANDARRVVLEKVREGRLEDQLSASTDGEEGLDGVEAKSEATTRRRDVAVVDEFKRRLGIRSGLISNDDDDGGDMMGSERKIVAAIDAAYELFRKNDERG